MSRGKSKGNAFEREIAKQLSVWWTAGERNDVFWRSQNSGARATQRSNQNQTTAGQYGDICAADPIGKSLTDLMIIEIKRGYNNQTMHAQVDKMGYHAETQWDKWISNLLEMSDSSGVPYWCVIHKRDQRETMIWMPVELPREIDQRYKLSIRNCAPLIRATCAFQSAEWEWEQELVGMLLIDFLEYVKPETIIRLSNDVRKNES